MFQVSRLPVATLVILSLPVWQPGSTGQKLVYCKDLALESSRGLAEAGTDIFYWIKTLEKYPPINLHLSGNSQVPNGNH
jgi:hypothetical protein